MSSVQSPVFRLLVEFEFVVSFEDALHLLLELEAVILLSNNQAQC